MVELRIKLNAGLTMYLISALIIIALSSYIIYKDISSTYTWVIPLNVPRAIHSFFKTEIAINYIDLASNTETLGIVRGVVFSVILDALPTGYAVMVLRGVNIYLFTLAICSIIVYLIIAKKLISKISKKNFLAYVVFTLMIVSTLTSLMSYTGYASFSSYTFSETPVELRFSNLKYLDLDETGNSLIFNASNKLIKLRYLYSISDTTRTLSLIRIRMLLEDQVYSVIYVNALGKSIMLVGNSSTALYVPSGSITLYIFSDNPIRNSKLIYNKVEFWNPTGELNIFITFMPLALLIASIVTGLTFKTILSKDLK